MKLGKIVQLSELVESIGDRGLTLYVTAGGFDPLHICNLRCLQTTHYLAADGVRHKDGARGVVIAVVAGILLMDRSTTAAPIYTAGTTIYEAPAAAAAYFKTTFL